MRLCDRPALFRADRTNSDAATGGRLFSKAAIAGLSLLSTIASVATAVAADVLTQRGSNERTGAYVDTTINQQLVADRGRWGVVGKLPIHGSIYAQPLFVENLQIPDLGPRNVVLVASALNNVAAFDAGSLTP